MASPNEKDDVPMLPISDSSRSVSLAITSSTTEVFNDDDAKGWAMRFAASINRYLPGITNPHSKLVKLWTKLYALTCVVAIFIDPLFYFLIKSEHENKCIVIDWPKAKVLVAVRSVMDVLFFVDILLQFGLSYVAAESTVVGTGQLVARHYFRKTFLSDLIVLMPVPQIWILFLVPVNLGSSLTAPNIFLRLIIVCQYVPKLFKLLPTIASQKPSCFLSESAWAKFVTNLLTFMLAGHVVGTLWYLLGQGVLHICLLRACGNLHKECRELVTCGGHNRNVWKGNASASACYQEDGYSYGIFLKAVNLTDAASLLTRYTYSLMWGFQQITTLTGGLVPNYNSFEVVFTMVIIGLGILLFPLLVGNMHNVLQTRRNSETTPLRPPDVEQRMSHEQLPGGIRKKVGLAEWVNWAATRGFNENLLFENMPNDLQRDIRRRLFLFLKKVRIFLSTDKSILDAIRERLKQRRYISSSKVLDRKGLVEEMVFIVRGKMESTGADGHVILLSHGDFCGEELLTWCLEHSSENPDGTRTRMTSKGLVSNRSVKCLTDVEAFSLSVADLEDITSLFFRLLRCQREQGAIRSPRWRLRTARQIQVPWIQRRRRLQRFYTAQSSYRL